MARPLLPSTLNLSRARDARARISIGDGAMDEERWHMTKKSGLLAILLLLCGAVACEGGYGEGEDTAGLGEEEGTFGAEPMPGDTTETRPGMGLGDTQDVEWISDVQVGSQLENGRLVSETEEFQATDPIIVSLQLDNPPQGRAVRLEVYDQNERQVWSEEQTLGQGGMGQQPPPDMGEQQPGQQPGQQPQNMNFQIRNGALQEGQYTAYVVVDNQRVEQTQFHVTGTTGGAAT